MKRQQTGSSHFAVCINNTAYPASLELHKIYRVIADGDAAEDGDIRVINESGEDYLYPGGVVCGSEASAIRSRVPFARCVSRAA